MGEAPTTIVLTGCEIDPTTGRVIRGARTDQLTVRERELLVYLWAHRGRDVPRDELLTEVWGYAPTAQTRAIDNMVRKLRRKIELDPDAPRHLVTVAGGYRLERPELPPDTRYPDRFVGRDALLDQIALVLAPHGAGVLLTGPPGVGKTRLAWEASRRWHRGSAWLCELRGARTVDELLGVVARTVGAPGSGVADREALVDRIALRLAAAGPALLVLDNVEQIEPGWPETLPRWLGGEVRLLATSRHPIPGLESERIEVGPLSTDLACTLFLERARRVWPALAPEPEIATLCDALGGLPLAIELAAARTGVMPVRELVSRLGSSLRALGDALGASLSWSWSLLAPPERDALGQCAVFAGGFDAAAVEAIVSVPGADSIGIVSDLISKGLIRTERVDGNVRMSLLPGIGAFVAERTSPGGAAERHVRWYASQLERDPGGTARRFPDDCVAALRRALDGTGPPAQAASLAFRLHGQLEWHVPQDARTGWLRAALQLDPPLSDRVLLRGKLADDLARLGSPDAEAELSWTEREASEGRDVDRVWALLVRGNVRNSRGDVRGAGDAYTRAHALAADHPALRSLLAANLGSLFLALGEHRAAEGWLREAATLDVPPQALGGNPRNRIRALSGLAVICAHQGREGESEALATEAAERAERTGDPLCLASVWLHTAVLRSDAGRHAEAAALLDRAQQAAETAGDRMVLARALDERGQVSLDLGDPRSAAEALAEALRHYTVLGRAHAANQVLALLGVARCLDDDPRGLLHAREAAARAGHATRASSHLLLALVTDDPAEAVDARRIAAAEADPEDEMFGALLALADAEEVPPEVSALGPRSLQVRLALALHAHRAR